MKALGTPMEPYTGTGESPVVQREIEGRAVSYVSHKAGSQSRYGYFRSRDPQARSGKRPEVQVRVLYFDQGKGSFSLNYDSSDSRIAVVPDCPGAWKFSGMNVLLTDSRTWRVATVDLKDAFFGGRCIGADLRIESADADLLLVGAFLSSAVQK